MRKLEPKQSVKKIIQTETWRLTDDEFPMHFAHFQFTEDTTSIKIFDKEDALLYSSTYPAFQFEGIPIWLDKILKMCKVI